MFDKNGSARDGEAFPGIFLSRLCDTMDKALFLQAGCGVDFPIYRLLGAGLWASRLNTLGLKHPSCKTGIAFTWLRGREIKLDPSSFPAIIAELSRGLIPNKSMFQTQVFNLTEGIPPSAQSSAFQPWRHVGRLWEI